MGNKFIHFVVLLFCVVCVFAHPGHSHDEREGRTLPPVLRSPPGPASLLMFPLNQVTLLPGTPAYVGQQVNKEYLHLLDADRLLYNFMITAGFNSSAEPLGGWEAPDCQLRGHFVGMYLSASAKAYNSYGDLQQKEKGDYIVSQIYKCQQALGSGYVSAFPTTLFDDLEALRAVWAPYYTIHKVMQGIWDMYVLTENQQAYEVVVAMANYFVGRIQNVIATNTIYRWQQILNVEYGGMNDVMYQVYSVTGNANHLWMAEMFDAGAFLGPILMGQDELTGLHANTHIPVIIGSARRYEVVGDDEGRVIAENFYEFVVGNRTYATGGHNGGNGSNVATNEHWGEPARLAATLTNNNQEFCTTYNTLKLAAHIIQWTGDVQFMDFYERAYFNGILGGSNVEAGPGVMLYNTPMATGFSKNTSMHGWGNQNNSFWCCYASGVEQWAKMGEAIYFYSADNTQLYVNLFVASTLNWVTKNVTVVQQTTFPTQQGTGLQILTPQPTTFSLNIHIPYWVDTQAAAISVNGVPLKAVFAPSSIFQIQQEWHNGDIINITLPMAFHLSHMIDAPTMVAVMYGPLVLVGLTSIPHTLPISNDSELASIIKPVPGNPLQFEILVDGGNSTMTLQPIYSTYQQTYGVYWYMQPKQ